MTIKVAVAGRAGTIEKRRHRRRRVWLPIVLRAGGVETTAWIRDLSCKGAMIETDLAILPGSKVVLWRKAIETPALVAWSRGGFAGVTFEEPFTEKALVDYSFPRAKRRIMRAVHGLRGERKEGPA
jgi:hypothetical protein